MLQCHCLLSNPVGVVTSREAGSYAVSRATRVYRQLVFDYTCETHIFILKTRRSLWLVRMVVCQDLHTPDRWLVGVGWPLSAKRFRQLISTRVDE